MAEEKAIMELDQYAKVKGRFVNVEFSETPNPLLICQLCQAVMNYPHQLLAGKKSVKRGCYICLLEVAQDDQQMEPVSMLEDLIAELEITCQRCDETVKIGELYRHDTIDCSELEIKCDACDVFLRKANLAMHQVTQEHKMTMLGQQFSMLSIEMTNLKKICDDQQQELARLHRAQETALLTALPDEEEKKDDVDEGDEKLLWSYYSFPTACSAQQKPVYACNMNDPAVLIVLPNMSYMAYVKTDCIRNSVVAYSFTLHQPKSNYLMMGLLKTQSTMASPEEFTGKDDTIANVGIWGGNPRDLILDNSWKAGAGGSRAPNPNFGDFILSQNPNQNKEINENEVLKRALNVETSVKITYLIDSRKRNNVRVAIYVNEMYTGLKYTLNCEKEMLMPYLSTVNHGYDCNKSGRPIATIIGYESASKVQELLADFMTDFAPISLSRYPVARRFELMKATTSTRSHRKLGLPTICDGMFDSSDDDSGSIEL
jgi:hypothetical protein